MRKTVTIALLAFVASPPTASASEALRLPDFRAVSLRGGGEVIIRHGPVQRVTILEGDSRTSAIEVPGPREWRDGNRTIRDSGQTLVIRPCRDRCPRGYRLRVEVVTPDISAVAIAGGGQITAVGGFRRNDSLALSIDGGGNIDARALQASSVGASINGGGLIATHPLNSLGASVRGGGTIRYWGNPTVGQQVRGGGAVVRAGR